MPTLKQGQRLEDMSTSLEPNQTYSIRAKEHRFPVSPVVGGEGVRQRLIDLGYYDPATGALKNVELEAADLSFYEEMKKWHQG
jgi:hypothetical protein